CMASPSHCFSFVPAFFVLSRLVGSCARGYATSPRGGNIDAGERGGYNRPVVLPTRDDPPGCSRDEYDDFTTGIIRQLRLF
ncbi:MAG TPA: hypothetical protein PLZ36_12555, partial [Armatimonadota bacterium]|nr:hypothetical protein [Armatimonadota bacterium]